jgi:hypothetical protein
MIPAEEQAQRRSALRSLLAKPLLVADTDTEALVLVRRHLTELRDWLNREKGWRFDADSETARPLKTDPLLSDTSRQGRGHNAARRRPRSHVAAHGRSRGTCRTVFLCGRCRKICPGAARP